MIDAPKKIFLITLYEENITNVKMKPTMKLTLLPKMLFQESALKKYLKIKKRIYAHTKKNLLWYLKREDGRYIS